MKKLSILALVLAFTMMLSVVSFAAEATAAFKVDPEKVPAGTSVTVPESDPKSLSVSTKATNDAYYGVLLVKGTDVPTVDDDILYIDQVTAKDGSATFNVLPILPEDNLEKDLTLYISSNASDAKLIKVPVAYGTEVVEEDILLGDVDGDDYITSWDGYYMTLFELGDMGIDIIMEDVDAGYCKKFWDENDETYAVKRGDVDGDGYVTSWDGYYVTLYELGDMGIEIIMEDIEAGYCQKFWKD